VWFLSIDKTSWIKSLIQNKYKPHSLAQQQLQCQQMGDYCFDPQVGLYKKGSEGGSTVGETIDLAEVDKTEKYKFLDPHQGAERSMIECDENSSFFDVFCGKAKSQKIAAAKAKLEVWVDVSSTMKQVDFNGFESECSRESFLRNLSKTCTFNQKMKAYYFDESRKEIGNFDRVCMNAGLNDMKRLIQDVNISKADHIIIITDIFEAEESFINAIEASAKSRIRGLDKPMYASDLKNELKRVRKFCE